MDIDINPPALLFCHAMMINTLTWSQTQLDKAINRLAYHQGIISERQLTLPTISDDLTPDEIITSLATQSGLEAERVETTYPQVTSLICTIAPAILQLPESQFLVLLKKGRWWVSVLKPDLTIAWVRPEAIRAALCEPLEVPHMASIKSLLIELQASPKRQIRIKQTILNSILQAHRLNNIWILRLPQSANIASHIRQAQLPQYALRFFALNLLTQIILAAEWSFVGRSALQSQVVWVWLIALALLWLTAIPLEMFMLWSSYQLILGLGSIFKQRLLFGTLQLDPETIRHLGVGHFLARVMESNRVETQILQGTLKAVTALIQVSIAAVFLNQGAGGWLHMMSLWGWVTLTLLTGWLRYYQPANRWVTFHRGLINDLVERMVGYRTRLAQETHWHEDEDRHLDRYFKLVLAVDYSTMQLSEMMARGWLVLGITGLAYGFITQPQTTTPLAIGLLGVMLAYEGMINLTLSISSMSQFVIGWQQIKPFFVVSNETNETQAAILAKSISPKVGQTIIELRDVTYRYPSRIDPVLQRCRLAINQGDRLLLEGPSGGGKSTLANILVGLKTPDSGLMLLHGLDQHTLGIAAWRQRIISAPQFHDNHVLTETFAFNLLMGRDWPPSEADLAEATQVCHELGLTSLLEKMPSGLMQMVGESGWQLSHGERSRLFIARALLQQADLIVLDESFASLDPENLAQVMACVLKRAKTVLVIAHP